MDQRICIKFCYKNGIQCSNVLEMLKVAFGDSAMSRARVFEWYNRFKNGREDVEDDKRPGRPSTSVTDDTVEKVKKMIMNDHRITIREVAEDVGISYGSVKQFLRMFYT